MKFLNKLNFDQKIIACLTTIIAMAAIVQATSAIIQVNLFTESEARDRQREQPDVLITPQLWPFTEKRGDDKVPKPYVGFDIVNKSHFEITVERIGLTKGWPIDENMKAAESIKLPHITKHFKSDMSDVSLPATLGYGEVLEVRYERDKIVNELNKWKGKSPLPVRPFCVDSLWNYHYKPDLWLIWTEDSTISAIDPGPAFKQVDEIYVY